MWSGVSCWRYGVERLPSVNPVTVIISLLESVSGTSDRSIQQIRKILTQEGVNGVDIIFKINEWWTKPRISARVDENLTKNSCQRYVQPGASIGIHGCPTGSSTLGCLVGLKFAKDPNWQLVALTCFHCTWPPPNKQPHLPAFDFWASNPVFPTDKRAE